LKREAQAGLCAPPNWVAVLAMRLSPVDGKKVASKQLHCQQTVTESLQWMTADPRAAIDSVTLRQQISTEGFNMPVTCGRTLLSIQVALET
jgi:hypothetical protein